MKRYFLNFSTLGSLCSLFAVSLLLSSCSTIKVIETWKKTDASYNYQKLLIVGLAHDENLREMAENILVDELRRGGVTAVASHSLVKEIDNAKREDIVAVVRATGADAVLSIRAIVKGDSKITQDGQSGGIYGTVTNVGGAFLPAAKSYSLATLQTNLYDSATAELVWSATIQTYDAEEVARVSRDLARYFLESVRKSKNL